MIHHTHINISMSCIHLCVLMLASSVFVFFDFVVFDFVSSVLAKRLAGKSISEMTYFVLNWILNVNSAIQTCS